MNNKPNFFWLLIGGIAVIASTIYFSFRYLMKGSPFIKILAVTLVAAVSYLVIDYLTKANKKR